ncbi:MAG TPA: type II secretion system protein, partial [Tepidisphaeraceae bacterium]|nr:type II secretion system protein [Tepidisphaeraceae bacterium]
NWAHRPTRRANGFTLIEVMVSIAIALLLILGINQVFKISSDTAGKGQAFSTLVRDDRTAQHTITNDLQNSVTTNAPFFLIRSAQQYAFRNKQDQIGASNQNDASLDPLFVTYNGKIPVAMVNYRSHRVDCLAFFARDLYNRQTSSPDNPGAPNVTNNESYIWYGHALIPNNAEIKGLQLSQPSPTNPKGTPWGYFPLNYYAPGQPSTANASNDNNLYTSDWILARVQMLMMQPPPDLGFYQTGVGPNKLYAPLSQRTPNAEQQNPPDLTPLEAAHYDVVNTTIQNYYNLLSTTTAASPSGALPDWYDPLISFRYQVNPFVTRPVSPLAAAKTAPIFLRSCTQFIVEFAGNYVTQEERPTSTAFGQLLGPTPDPDGKIDFIVDKSNGTNPAQWVRKIRWYGFPRDTNGDGIIDPNVDVVPLRDILALASQAAKPPVPALPATFEHFDPGFPGPGADYMKTLSSNSLQTYDPSSYYHGPTYICAWGPNTPEALPKMIRITLALDDPNGRLGDAQTYEYIINLQP